MNVTCNLLKTKHFQENAKKRVEKRKKLLRLSASIRKYPFTGGAEALRGARRAAGLRLQRLRGGHD
jgi:hypothetical protein